MKRSNILVMAILSVFLSYHAFAQDVPEHPSRTDIYEFLAELADLKYVDYNSVAQPLSRHEIFLLLKRAQENETQLRKRQRDELAFYLDIYGQDFIEGADTINFYFSDLLRGQGFEWPKARYDFFSAREGDFRISINPIGGYQRMATDSGWMYSKWNGAEAFASMGDHWSFYASLRDNHESIRLTDPNYLNDFSNVNYKLRGVGGDYSEMRTGITYSWDWGYVSLRKDHFVWGNNQHGANIFGGRQPSYPYFVAKLKPVPWFEFQYIQGWLVSEIIDSARTYVFPSAYGNGTRLVFIPKNLAANLFSIRPFKHTWISVGNSIVYSDLGLHPAFLLPLGFFKSIDHTITGTGSNWLGQNSQMFADVSIREIKHVHLYSTLFVDEISFSHIWDSTSSNFLSIKAGISITDLPRNLSWGFEYTRNNPLTFQHNMPMTTFASNYYNLGHYLRDNSDEIYAQLSYKPLKNLHFKAWYLKARRGPDYNNLGGSLVGLPFVSETVWSHLSYGASASWQVFNNVFIEAALSTHDYGGNGNLSDFGPAFMMADGLQYDLSVRLSR